MLHIDLQYCYSLFTEIKLQTLITLFSWQVETKLEREARGQPVGRDVPYAAMGGLIGFSSLLDGYLALEPSGSGEHVTT